MIQIRASCKEIKSFSEFRLHACRVLCFSIQSRRTVVAISTHLGTWLPHKYNGTCRLVLSVAKSWRYQCWDKVRIWSQSRQFYLPWWIASDISGDIPPHVLPGIHRHILALRSIWLYLAKSRMLCTCNPLIYGHLEFRAEEPFWADQSLPAVAEIVSITGSPGLQV